MELKKNPKYDLNNKMGMLRNLGLTISLLAVIVVFEMPARGNDEIIDLGVLDNEAVEVIDVPPTTQPPPPPPKMLTVPEIVEVPDEEEIEEPDENTILKADDTLIVRGKPRRVERAERFVLEGD